MSLALLLLTVPMFLAALGDMPKPPTDAGEPGAALLPTPETAVTPDPVTSPPPAPRNHNRWGGALREFT